MGKYSVVFFLKNFLKKKVFGGPCGRHFLPDMFTVCGPFNKLLKDNEKFVWSQALWSCIWKNIETLASELCWTHFNQNLTTKTKLTVNASPIAVEAILSQVDEKDIEKPIEFPFQSLSETKRKYA